MIERKNTINTCQGSKGLNMEMYRDLHILS